MTEPEAARASRGMFWAGWALTLLAFAGLTFSGVLKLTMSQEVAEGFSRLGYPQETILGIGALELICTALFLFPRTAVLGAILLTGYLGGATATHVRIHDPYWGPVIGGILVWGALWLRDSRVRALAPWRRTGG